MSDINPDHLKYMPHGEETSQETPPEEVTEVAEETVVLEEEPEIPDRNEEKHHPKNEEEEENAPLQEEDEINGIIERNVPASVVYNFLNPLLIPTYATILIFLLSLLVVVAPVAVVPYGLTVFGATAVLPALIIYVLQRIGIIRSLNLHDRSDRLVPYVIEFLALGAMAIFFIVKGAMPWIWTIFCGGAAIALVNFAINFRIRISNHCSAIAALLAVLIVIQVYGIPPHTMLWWAIGTTLLAGAVGTLSILKGRHTLWEVLAGYATGFLGIILFSLIH